VLELVQMRYELLVILVHLLDTVDRYL
jgi:hypothetical protein